MKATLQTVEGPRRGHSLKEERQKWIPNETSEPVAIKPRLVTGRAVDKMKLSAPCLLSCHAGVGRPRLNGEMGIYGNR